MTMDETIEAAIAEPYRKEIERLRAKLKIAMNALACYSSGYKKRHRATKSESNLWELDSAASYSFKLYDPRTETDKGYWSVMTDPWDLADAALKQICEVEK